MIAIFVVVVLLEHVSKELYACARVLSLSVIVCAHARDCMILSTHACVDNA